MTSFELLLERKRGTIAEIMVHGSVCWVHGQKIIHHIGGDPLIYGRSLMKPFQIKVFTEELSDLSERQQAIALSSHNGTTTHIELAQSLLDKEDWGKLQTPASLPLGGCSNEKSRWHHPCSGKHAAILRGCIQKGWPTKNYLDPSHPYHKAYLQQLELVLGTDQQTLVACPDGCGLPTLGHRVSELARSFAYLAKNRTLDWIWPAMTNHPLLIGGNGRMDTEIMEQTKGKVLAKEGADGLLGLALLNDNFPEGLGIVLKIAHGRDELSMKQIAAKIIHFLGFEGQPQMERSEQVTHINENILPRERAR